MQNDSGMMRRWPQISDILCSYLFPLLGGMLFHSILCFLPILARHTAVVMLSSVAEC